MKTSNKLWIAACAVIGLAMLAFAEGSSGKETRVVEQSTVSVIYRQPNRDTPNMEMRINDRISRGWRFVGSAENESLNGDGTYSKVVTLVFER